VVWRNDDSGGIRMPQPHGGAVAESGVSAQGYLVAAGDRLLVPTGRAVPACFDRADGKFRYFHLQAYGQKGGSATTAAGEMFVNAGVAYDVASGKKVFAIGRGPLVAMPDGLVHAKGKTVAAHTRVRTEARDRRGVARTTVKLKKRWSQSIGFACTSLIVAGDRVVAGGQGRVATLALETGKPAWSADVSGTVYSLAATGEGLFAATDDGSVYCLGDGKAAAKTVPADRPADPPYPDNSPASQAADRIVRQSGVTEGYCVDLGCGDGALAYHLARRTRLFVCAVDDDAGRVAQARAKLTLAGLYGARVVVQRRTLADTGYPDYFANLVVSGRSIGEGEAVVSAAEAERLQRPFGGVICVGKPGSLTTRKRGPMAGAGSWTHQYADPANTACSGDRLVRGRLGMLWFRAVDFEVANRHGRAPAPLCHEGRLVYGGLHGVIALDAYNGHELWRRSIKNLLTAYNGDELMGVAGTGSNVCMAGDSVYVRHETRCLRLHAATGKRLAEYVAPPDGDGKPPVWGYIACKNGVLYGSAADPAHVVTYRFVNRGGDMKRLLTESRRFFALDVETGEVKWSYRAKHSLRHNAIALAGGKVFLIDRPPALFDRRKRPKTRNHPTGALVALDDKTGKILWQQDDRIDGTMLAVGAKHNALLMSYQPTRFRLDSERGGRLTVFAADTGRRLWSTAANYRSRPIVNDRTIYAQGGAWDLLTGKPVPFEFQRSYGCGILSAGAHMLLFRSATLGYYDLSGKRRTEDFGGIRPGCWINAIAAGGIVLMPDSTADCRCSYLTRAWVGLQAEPSPGSPAPSAIPSPRGRTIR
jgi:outer membrane protein assembly factor BamB